MDSYPSSSTGSPPPPAPMDALLSLVPAGVISHTHAHSTWARTFTSFPELLIAPTTETQLRAAVLLARTSRRRIALVGGAAHSPSPLTCTSSWLVTLRRLDRVLSADVSTGVVVAQAGISLRALSGVLEREYGLTLPDMGSIDAQSIAGALATGTHGSSLRHGLLAECVLGLRLVMADGEVATCRRDADNFGERELFRAAVIGLGAIGIITEVELRAVPMFRIRWTQEIHADETMLAAWEAGRLWDSREWVRVWWLPHTRRALVWSADRLEEPKQGHPKETETEMPGALATWATHTLHRTLHALAHWFPSTMPWVEWLFFGIKFGFRNGGAATSGVQRSSRGLLTDCLYSQVVNEWAIPLSKGPEALRRLSAIINPSNPISCSQTNPLSPTVNSPQKTQQKQKRMLIHVPIEIRTCNTNLPSSYPYAHLDPSTRSEPTLYLNTVAYRPLGIDPPGLGEWHAAFEQTMRDLGGRPHWAKNFTTSHDGLVEMYGDKLRAWKDVRRRVDPDGVFVGPWLREKVLGPEGGERLRCEEVEVGREWVRGRGWVVRGEVGGG